jgi:hypothetical protein
MPRNSTRRGNGRTAEENREYARLASNSTPRATQLANAAAGRAARAARLAAEIDPGGTMDPADLAREIKRRKDAQLAKARGVRLTMLRRAREAAEALIAAEAAERAAVLDHADAAPGR